MMTQMISACAQGVEAVPVTVEVDVRANRLSISIVGLPDAATRESRDRLVPAITNSGFSLQESSIVINLGPADLRKEGSAFDLAMAVGILGAMGLFPAEACHATMLLGELALDGALKCVRAALACAECAKGLGMKRIVLPIENAREAALVSGIEVLQARCLQEVIYWLRGSGSLSSPDRQEAAAAEPQQVADFMEVKGQSMAKRAMEIAAAGGHNLLLQGPPGSGKSMLSKRLPGILPPLSEEEFIEVLRIYSAAGKAKVALDHWLRRPFRAPHHTASPIALIGGGTNPRPGEVTLAHKGILFLDEFPEFPRTVLEVLRQPLEDRHVTISRASQQITFPADFLLVAAMNPCPCGWHGDRRRSCSCSPDRIQNYRQRISGPLLDRIDLQVEVPSVSLSTLRSLPPAEASADIARRVNQARRRQRERFSTCLVTNGCMSSAELTRCCTLRPSSQAWLDAHADSMGLSGRVYDKILRLARTIADLAGASAIEDHHLQEAIAFRKWDQPVSIRTLQATELS